MGPLGSYLGLIHAGLVLIRHDALLPREVEAALPPAARWVARLLRLGAGPQARPGRPGERLATALETLGPAAIKLGQVLSTRADVFGTGFAEDLGRLKDRLAPFPQAVAEAEVEKALGRPLGAFFRRFGPAVAAASIAQAHEAEWIDGRRVAVKVLRPGVERRVQRDIAALRLGAALIERAFRPARRLRPRAFVETVARSLALELDLRLEAAGASELGEIMARDSYMRAPAVVWEGVGRRVLTLEWAQGAALSDPASLARIGIDRSALALNLVRGFLAQALDHGAFHADLHEGNLFVAAPATVVAVDFGIIGRIGSKERRYLAEILWGFLQRDYRRVADVHFAAGYVPHFHEPAQFAQALRAVGEPIFGRAAADVSMGRLLSQLFEITALFDMRLRPELVLLQKTMVSVEGVARRLDPAFDIWAASAPVVERWISRELGPAARIRSVAETLLRRLEVLAAGLDEAPRTPDEAAVTVTRTPSAGETWAGRVALLLSGAALVLAASAWAILAFRALT